MVTEFSGVSVLAGPSHVLRCRGGHLPSNLSAWHSVGVSPPVQGESPYPDQSAIGQNPRIPRTRAGSPPLLAKDTRMVAAASAPDREDSASTRRQTDL